MFGPVMIVWFLAIGACGISGIADHPEILKALSPTYALGFLGGHFSMAFFSLAAVVLAITGAEALYADMGHFSRGADHARVARARVPGVHPQLPRPGRARARASEDGGRAARSSCSFPHWGRLAMVLLATAATVIASQAVITGAFSVTHQAVQLGYLPRLRIEHTSEQTIGQIYVPWINWVLMVSVLGLVFAFRTSAALAFAFGMAVTGTITITTLLFFYIVRHQWRKPLWLVVAGGGALLIVDLLFLAANLTKITHGAWLPLLIGVTVFTVLITWQRGRLLVTKRRERDEGSLRAFIDRAARADSRRCSACRAPRCFSTAARTPRRSRCAPTSSTTTSCTSTSSSSRSRRSLSRTSRPADRLVVDDLGYADDGISHVAARFGYKDDAQRPARAPPGRIGGPRMPARDRRGLVLPLHDRAAHGR